ncbi:hypothetical protein [Roseateles sp. P5_E1]
MLQDADCHDPAGLSLTRLLDALALGAVLVLAWRACHGHHHRRRRAHSARAPVAVQTWEGEGGRPTPTDA